MRRILSVSYDQALLLTRQMLLERQGYSVTSCLGFTDAVVQCANGGFDLLVLGHSIPRRDKEELIRSFRQHSHGPVLSLRRGGEPQVELADYHVFCDDPGELLDTVAAVFQSSRS